MKPGGERSLKVGQGSLEKKCPRSKMWCQHIKANCRLLLKLLGSEMKVEVPLGGPCKVISSKAMPSSARNLVRVDKATRFVVPLGGVSQQHSPK